MFGGAGTGTVTGTESKNTESYTGPRGSGQEQSSFAKQQSDPTETEEPSQ